MAMSPEHHAKRAEHHAGEARKHAVAARAAARGHGRERPKAEMQREGRKEDAKRRRERK